MYLIYLIFHFRIHKFEAFLSFRYDSTLRDECALLCKRWTQAGDDEVTSFSHTDIEAFSAPQTMQFLSECFDQVSKIQI